MKLNSLLRIAFLFIALPFLFLSSCKDDEEPTPAPATGKVTGIVTDGLTANPLPNVRVVLFNANSNEPTGNIDVTDSNGVYNFTAKGGNYYVKLTKQEYEDVPVRGFAGLSFPVSNGSTVNQDVEMYASGIPDLGIIGGQLTSTNVNVDGALVVATNGDLGYSTISDSMGRFTIYNVPPDDYSVQAWRSGLESTAEFITLSAGDVNSNVNLIGFNSAGNKINGSITFLATSNASVDVALTHPESKEAIPGLTTVSNGSSYSLQGVGNGTYLARASFQNDGIVMDPDWIVKNGPPLVVVPTGSSTRNFSVTGAVTLDEPTNTANSTVPVETSAIPTFTWTDYPSTTDYVIEVTDANGQLVWGGFDSNWTVKNIVIPSSENSIEFNSDGSAVGNLETGRVYRWKIYASKDDAQSPTGWELISVSEDQRGLIIIE